MIEKKYISILLASTLMTTFTGCQYGKVQLPQTYTQGNAFFAKQNYKQAIENYQRALKKAPKNIEIKNKLKQAKSLYVKSILKKLNEEFSQTDIYSLQKISSFQTKSNELGQYTDKSNNQALLDFKKKINEQSKTTTSQIESLYKEIDGSLLTAEYEKTAKALKQILLFDEQANLHNNFKKNLDLVDQYYAKEITDFLYSNNKQALLDAFLEYKKLNLNPSAITALGDKIDQYNEINTLINSANKYISTFRLNDASKIVNRLDKIKNDNMSLQEKIKVLRKRLIREFIKLATEANKENKIAEAYNYLLQAVNIQSSVKFTTVSKSILATLYEKAKKYTSLGLNGNAYDLYLHIQKIDPNYKSTFLLHKNAKDKLLSQNILKIAVSEFVTPNLDRSSGSRFSASLTSQLFKQTQKDLHDINIIERNRLKAILDELKLRETGNLESLAQRGKIKGINVFVFGDIVESSVEPQRRESTEQTKVQIGTRKVNNNQFMLYMMASSEEKRKWKKVPQEFIEEPVYQLVSYKKGEIKKTATMVISVRVVDIEKGEIIAAETMESLKEAHDSYSDSVKLAGILGDPEEIVSDRTLLKDLHNDMIQKISNFVLKPFSKREETLLEKCTYLMERREYTKAMENIVNAMIVSEIKGREVSTEINQKQDELFKLIIE